MLGDMPGTKGRIFGFDQFPAVCVEEIDALQQRHRVRLDLYDIPQLHAGEYHQVLADMQVIFAHDLHAGVMQDTQVRQDGAGDRVLDGHHAVIGLTGLDLARHFAKRRAGMDRDIRSEAAVRHNVVERSFVPLYSDFKLSFHLVFPFVIGRSSARAVPHKKSRPWVRTGIDIVSSNDSFAINNAIPVRFW